MAEQSENIINHKHIWKSPKFIIVAVLCLIVVIVAITIVIASAGGSDDDIVHKLETAQKYLTEMKYEEAKALFEEIIETDPKCEEAYIGLADAYMGLGKEDKAVEVLEKAMDEVGKTTDLRKKLNEVEKKQKEKDKNKETETAEDVTTNPVTEPEGDMTIENNESTEEQDTTTDGITITEADTTSEQRTIIYQQQQTTTRPPETTVSFEEQYVEDVAKYIYENNSYLQNKSYEFVSFVDIEGSGNYFVYLCGAGARGNLWGELYRYNSKSLYTEKAYDYETDVIKPNIEHFGNSQKEIENAVRAAWKGKSNISNGNTQQTTTKQQATEATMKGVHWKLEGATLTVYGNGDMQGINSNGMYASPWAGERDKIETVIIEEGVTGICVDAFYSCSNLQRVSILSSVTYIEMGAFNHCDSLADINIPNSVTYIGIHAFSYSGLKNINIPDGVTSIGDNAFKSCNSLKSVSISGSVKTIGNWAFDSCFNIVNIEISEGVEIIGENAFSNCYDITSIKIPTSVTSIGDFAFDGCSSLTTIYGTKGSYAETYANQNGYTFIAE